jgi:hypothetical protein
MVKRLYSTYANDETHKSWDLLGSSASTSNRNQPASRRKHFVGIEDEVGIEMLHLLHG